MAKKYDVAIVGSGAAGMAAAIELDPSLNTVMIEGGENREGGSKNISSGFGGCGAFTDGKLNFSSEIGGHLGEILTPGQFEELSRYVDDLHLRFGADPSRLFKGDAEKIAEFKKRAQITNRLTLITSCLRHLGSDNAFRIVENIFQHLNTKVEILLESPVVNIEKAGDIFKLSVTGKNPGLILAKNVIVAAGRGGQRWWEEQARRLGLNLTNTNKGDVGVRVEAPAEITKDLTDAMYEPKFTYYCKTDEKVRTFCMCPYGEVTLEKQPDLGFTTVNGHSYAEKKSKNTNFAVLFTLELRPPFQDSIGFIIGMAQQVNRVAEGGVIVQRLKDIRDGRSSTPSRIRAGRVEPTLGEPYAIPGDLNLAIYPRIFNGLLEMLRVLDEDEIIPGINSDDTLLYGIEVKTYTVQTEADPQKGFETAIPGLRVIGDVSGWTRSLMQAWMTGIMAARAIVRK